MQEHATLLPQAMSFDTWQAGAAHLAGRWTVTGSAQVSADAPRLPMQGSSEIQPLFSGQMMEERLQAEILGMPYCGVGVLAYERMHDRLNAVWIDTLGGLLRTSGQYHAADGVHELRGEGTQASSPDPVQVRQVSRRVDADHHVFEIYEQAADGTERLVIDMHYERV